MSYDLIVYGPTPGAGTRVAWQAALDAMAGGFALPRDVDPARWSGLVALGTGDPAPGFLLQRRTLDAGELDPERLGPYRFDVAARLMVVSVAYDLSAALTAVVAEWNALWRAAGALAAAVDGVLRDPQSGSLTAGPRAIEAALAAVSAGNGAAADAVVPTPWGPMPRATAEARARAENRPRPGLFSITLLDVSGDHPALVRTVGRAMAAGDGRARSALRALPLVLATNVSRTYADELQSRLEGFGATVVVA